MEEVHKNDSERRAETDASLVAERASADSEGGANARAVLRQLDDGIEHDRIVADERLLKFRGSMDVRVARCRLEETLGPLGLPTLAGERAAEDERKKVERGLTDDVLAEERQRSDVAVLAERQEHEADRLRLEAHRHETDTLLGTERSVTDITVAALGETRGALDRSRIDQAHQSDLLAMVTHDLRSPLSVIVMNVDCILEETTDPSIKEAAREALLATARMNRLLTDLLDVARVESGTLRIHRRPHDVRVLVDEVLKSYRPLFAARGVTLATEAPDVPLIASFDYDRIVQVLSNLLGNAMKYTPRRGTVVLRVEQGAGQIELTLRDSGTGIRADAVPHIFERFWQLDKEERRGLGLGLYICQVLVEAHGGRIGVESTYGKGATFRFTLPEAAAA
jgi:signal transduction histidine kinase